MWRLSGELAVNCSTLVDLPRQTHGLRWMRDELMAPPDQRLTLNGADDVQHWRQTLSIGYDRHTSVLYCPFSDFFVVGSKEIENCDFIYDCKVHFIYTLCTYLITFLIVN